MHGSLLVRERTAKLTRRGWGRSFASLLAVGALVAGLAMVFIPYSRSLVGYVDGSREIAEAQCGVPIVEAVAPSGSQQLTASETWIDGPPCGHSARYRVGLGAILFAGGAYVLMTTKSRGRRIVRSR